MATVVDGFAETDQYARFDVEPTMMVSVFRTGEQSALEIAARVHEYVDEAQARMPPGVTLTVWQDESRVLNARLGLMLRSGAGGFILVFIVLTLFLELRLAFWVSLGIPISFLGAIAVMPSLDVSINIMSLFAFVLVLGIVVDDAIIVGENIFSHQEKDGDGLGGGHLRGAGDREAGHVCGADDCRGLSASDVRARDVRQVLPRHPARCDSVSALLPDRVAADLARPPVTHGQEEEGSGVVAAVPRILRQRV